MSFEKPWRAAQIDGAIIVHRLDAGEVIMVSDFPRVELAAKTPKAIISNWK